MTLYHIIHTLHSQATRADINVTVLVYLMTLYHITHTFYRDLSHNRLTEVPDGVSFVTKYTTILRLNDNPLGNMGNNVFVGRLHTIQQL